MKRLLAVFIVILFTLSSAVTFANADTLVNIAVNGNLIYFTNTPFIRNGVTYVDAKALCDKLSLSYVSYTPHDSIVISSARASLCLSPLAEYATVSDLSGSNDAEFIFRKMTAPAFYEGNTLYVAARDIASVFGYSLSYNSATATVYFGYAPEIISAETSQRISELSYYFQNQTEFNLPSFGSGYCWTCSYAMLITNATGKRITPNDVAAVNMSKGANGNYCYHSDIVRTFGVKFVSALSETSPYYAGRDGVSGGTYINNPAKDDNVVRAALREALTLHPEGVLVRYAAFPHTMVAVASEGEIILFNDPAPSKSNAYSDTGRYQGVPFSKTCVGAKGFKLSDITFIQAID